MNIVETTRRRVCVEDTDEGERLRERIADLKALVLAYRQGEVKELS